MELCSRNRWPVVFCPQLQEGAKKEMKARGLIPRFLARRQPASTEPLGHSPGFLVGKNQGPKACWANSWHKSHGGEEPVSVPSQTADCSLSYESGNYSSPPSFPPAMLAFLSPPAVFLCCCFFFLLKMLYLEKCTVASLKWQSRFTSSVTRYAPD